MKVVIFSALFMSSAFACPSLQGQYPQCKLSGYYPDFNTKSLSISQQENEFSLTTESRDGVFETSTMTADNQPQVTYQNDEGTTFKITTTVSCDATRLVINELTQVDDADFSMTARELISKSGEKLIREIYVESELMATITCE